MKLSLPCIPLGSCLLALAAALILPALAAHATPMTFFANLSGANEMTYISAVFAVGLAVRFAAGYAVRAAISLRHRQAAIRRRYLL